MNDSLIALIQRFTLDARGRLEREAGEQLEGLYGWLPGGDFGAADRYPALRLAVARETRRRLEAHDDAEREAGVEAA